MDSIQDNVEEQQVQNQKDTRFNINDSVWIAVAAMTYEIYYKKQNAGQPIYVPDFTLVQSDICNRTEVINGHKAEWARTSQWCCGDHENHTYCFLRAVEDKRRLSFPGEFGGKEEPENLKMDEVISTDVGSITIQQLHDFVHKEYAALEKQIIRKTDIMNNVFPKNMILYGPPGTGKTYNTVKYAVAICEGKPLSEYDQIDYVDILRKYENYKAEGRIAFTTFHQSYGYEEFIEGIKPVLISGDSENKSKDIQYDVMPGLFKSFCKIASMKWDEDEGEEPCVFIIDEINRGNISKIFGELITLIEETKRADAEEAMETTLPYSGETFSVPNNVYILGTMNTADRSIALMDTALRRRFDFEEMMPDSKVLSGVTIKDNGETLDVARMLDVINERIEFLYDREHTIGHAFFTKLIDNPSFDVLADIFRLKVLPLLQEYFYEDYAKIQLVLGDNEKSDPKFKFILDEKVKAKSIFKGNPEDIVDLPEKKYVIQDEAFEYIQSYIEIE